LGDRCGLKLPEAAEVSAPSDDQRQIYAILAEAARFYAQQLREHSHSQHAVDYLKGRGLSGEIAARFQLGFAPLGWTNLSDKLGAGEAAQTALVKAGLGIRRDDGSLYDRFRNRIIFPIHDHRGRVIGFGGRAIGDDEPKYLNSPETAVFHKGRELYGLYQFRQDRGDAARLLVVEGYMDVLALHQFGVTNAVATLGTATTSEHVSRLFRATPELVFCFDGDAAGQRAAWRALETVLPHLSEGRAAGFLFMPSGEDPDTLVRSQGPDFFQDPTKITPLSDFLFDELQGDLDVTSIEGQARLADKARPLIDKVPGKALRHLLSQRLSDLTQLECRAIEGMLANRPASRRSRPLRASRQQPSLVRTAVTLLLHRPGLAAKVAEPSRLADLELPGSDLLVELLEVARNHPHLTCAGLLEHFRNHGSEAHLRKLAIREPETPDQTWEEEFDATIERLVKLRDRQRRQTLALKSVAELSQAEALELRELGKSN
jgi:DNA primase